ncbi:MAG: phosphate-binding protein [Candidatus Edwardsbacteria bacterium RIFOXYD12_FULL_50_11]|uniref:Phosphate-binding protein n=1 Tax=Candidatus Edwardsbacteria bacterium GWF2_54_11 TaxID=1817851 RepID=A0A1F5RI89_9BACT|nr:MAG: phosphate-binding protein [Candidatus Edwardsbacteria bacterium RifOxyC12_full_54_24]OGF07149.1 MAG: phosphate-binding protein [Candidatus Edwardsbacteria bacterium RifOxyA12_full_54_48]OGF11104.1 MAG: phosphate-binding protein [Candidatus Edwardsbacteria bacterium GWE2_54_12]OGF14139.1 MAG: phosphate-binding protein [Candidatus Edwardsbacteria bacterium GWF2_54_11]OGF16050.1 MAG: phosphate-binding protein [Candidatus Edwardsbacteria bacterium RIFOXYD12_FULL_50_11]OGJ17615.1 MAG: phosp
MKTIIFWASLALVVITASSFVMAGKAITLKGSDTLLMLGQRWAELYMQKNPGVVIQVTGGGSGVGIAALINGSTDICQASRSMKDSEKKKLRERYFNMGTEIPVAKDGVTIYINEKNPVDELTLDQIRDIYTGKTTNWSQLGGPDAKIIVYGRENSSGTYVFFRESAMKNADYTSSMQSLPGTAAVVNAVAKDKFGIGYGGAAYAKGVKEVAIKTAQGSFRPTTETVKSGQYPLSRDLYWYLRGKPSGEIKKMIDWVLSPEGQEVVKKVGYFTVK